MMRIDRTDWQIRLIQLLAVPGILVAFYLLLFHNGDVIAACGASGWDDCGSVSGPNAPYSTVGPVPVALIGLVGYVLIFGASWVRDWIPELNGYLPEIMIGLTGMAFLFTLWLTALEAFVIHAFCRYCLVSAGLVTIMFLLAISYLREVNARDLA